MNVWPASRERSVRPLVVRTITVAPSARTCSRATPARAVRTHHELAAPAGTVAVAINTHDVSHIDAHAMPTICANRRRVTSVAIEPRHNADGDQDVRDRMDDHGGPQR